MSTEQKAPTKEQIQEAIQANLAQMHVASFDKYLQAKYPEGVKDIPQETVDAQFEAFCCGFNAGIFQSAGELLAIVGVNLNHLSALAKQESDK